MIWSTRWFGVYAGIDAGTMEPCISVGWGPREYFWGGVRYRRGFLVHIPWPPPRKYYRRAGDLWSEAHPDALVYDSSTWTGRPRSMPVQSRIDWGYWRPKVYSWRHEKRTKKGTTQWKTKLFYSPPRIRNRFSGRAALEAKRRGQPYLAREPRVVMPSFVPQSMWRQVAEYFRLSGRMR